MPELKLKPQRDNNHVLHCLGIPRRAVFNVCATVLIMGGTLFVQKYVIAY